MLIALGLRWYDDKKIEVRSGLATKITSHTHTRVLVWVKVDARWQLLLNPESFGVVDAPEPHFKCLIDSGLILLFVLVLVMFYVTRVILTNQLFRDVIG